MALDDDNQSETRPEQALIGLYQPAHATIDKRCVYIAILDENGVIMATNGAWTLFAQSNPALCVAAAGVGSNYLTACVSASGSGADVARTFANGIRAVIRHQCELYELEYSYELPDERGWFVGRVTRTEGDGFRRIIVMHEDVTAHKRLEEQIQQHVIQVSEYGLRLERQTEELRAANARLEALATTDGLTGLKNHRAFQEFLHIEFERSRRYRTPLSLMLADIDRFKQYNDTFGHPAGDAAMKAMAKLLLEHARVSDFVARYGGEEFVVVLPNTDGAGACAVAERLRTAISEAEWTVHSITASFGVATLTPAILSCDDLIAAADKALYCSKADGRNRVTHFDLPESGDPTNL